MLVEERFDRLYFRDIIEAIFMADNREDANAIIEHYSRFWTTIIGTRGAVGKKTINASSQFAALFEEEDTLETEETIELDETKLEELEHEA